MLIAKRPLSLVKNFSGAQYGPPYRGREAEKGDFWELFSAPFRRRRFRP